ATQSSTMAGPAGLAVDGNPDGNFARGSTTATAPESAPFWEVDLVDSLPLSSITLFNRTDCCKAALASFTVFVSDAPMVGRTLAELDADAAVWKHAVADPVSVFVTLPITTRGRHVRVQLRGMNTSLSLAEVVVMG